MPPHTRIPADPHAAPSEIASATGWPGVHVPTYADAHEHGWPDGGLHQKVVKVNVPGTGVGAYPAAERDVFGFLEGAFYGNLFKPDNLRRTCEVSLDGTKLELSLIHI